MPEPYSVIHAPRLDLVLMLPGLIEPMLAADWATAGRLLGAEIPDEWQTRDWRWVSMRYAQTEDDPAAIFPWLPRVQLLRQSAGDSGGKAAVVGDVGFHGPPDDEGRVEIGYAVLDEYRRRGFAEEAVRALLAWAEREQGITRFRARIELQNIPSLNLIRKLGFTQTKASQDQPGGLLVFHRDAPVV
jgi:[ribosomal protein S5]-alanine N-acetyltransferase